MNRDWSVPKYSAVEFRPKSSRYSVCPIVFNEGERIRNQLREMRRYSSQLDIIIADGDSSDGSLDPNFLKEQGIRTLLVTPERGLSTATRLALAYSMDQGYEGTITIDGNGKDGIEALPEFISNLEAGFDHVQGSRFLRGGEHENTPFERFLAIKLLAAPICRLSGFNYTDPTNAFRGLSRNLLLDPRFQPFRPIFVDYSLQHYIVFESARLGFKVKEIPVRRNYPEDGTVPTKIKGMGTRLKILSELIRTAAGSYRPR